jgi:hypothetical protein
MINRLNRDHRACGPRTGAGSLGQEHKAARRGVEGVAPQRMDRSPSRT